MINKIKNSSKNYKIRDLILTKYIMYLSNEGRNLLY